MTLDVLRGNTSMKHSGKIAFRGLWAVAWRSVALLPYMLGVFLVLFGVVAGLLGLPIAGLLYALAGAWLEAALSFSAWLALFWAWRHFRLRRFFESPSSLL